MTVLKQIYANYTPEDHQVWQLLYERQMKMLPSLASKSYLEAIEKIGFQAHRIPNYDEVNEHLLAISGWKIYVVEGLIPNKEFFELLKIKQFPASTWLRKLNQLDYLEEPDMFHDVFGHIPLLTNANFCGFLEKLSQISLKYIDNPDAVEMIARLYWFSVEFGLIGEDGKLKIYGAGIMSSSGESIYSIKSEIPKRVAYNVREMMRTPYIKERFQDKYFVIDSYKQLFDSTLEIEQVLEEELAILA